MKALTLVFLSIFGLFWMHGTGQEITIPMDFKEGESNIAAVHYLYSRSFPTKSDALKRHLEVLDSNGVEFDHKGIEPELDCPLLIHFKDNNRDDIVYISYVRKLKTGEFESVFLECDNVPVSLFRSDGFNMMYEPKKKRKPNKNK